MKNKEHIYFVCRNNSNNKNIKQFRNKKKLLRKHYSCKLGTILQFWVWARIITMQNRNNISLFSCKYSHLSFNIFNFCWLNSVFFFYQIENIFSRKIYCCLCSWASLLGITPPKSYYHLAFLNIYFYFIHMRTIFSIFI